MKDIKLDTITHDLSIENYDLSLVDGIERVLQNLRIRLWFFYSEWFLDTRVGVQMFETMAQKNPDLPRIETMLKETILTTQDVVKLITFSMEYDVSGRALSVDFVADTIFGEISFSEPLGV